MRRSRSFLMAVFGGLFVAACRDGTGPGTGPSLVCAAANTEALAVGQRRILDPNQDDACVRLPTAGPSGAQYLYVPVATAGTETEAGVQADYRITGASPAAAAARALPSPLLSAFRPPVRAGAFHAMLRERERDLSQSASVALFDRSRVMASTAVPVMVGEQRTFQVCSTPQCNSFVDATATAQVVGNRVAIFVDNDAPAPGYTNPDLVAVGALFDDFLYPIDTTAFGRESDIDTNGVVIVLLTHRVNALSPDCDAVGSVILGYFFGADLLPRSNNNPGSNEAEIFYGLVPDINNPTCSITEQFARERLPPTFIHEFQHMISFNQHRLIRGGSAEDIWLNEGLSHFAEELGARRLPATECASGSCFQDFLKRGNIPNAYAYLQSPEDFFLIEPGSSNGTLEERGANWLFVRWLADHFATDSVLGTDLTRRLVATSLVGAANVVAQTSVPFSVLVPEWQMTNYLDDLPGFNQPGARLRYKSWNFRQLFPDSIQQPFPLVPDNTTGNGYSLTGVLRAGSGPHVLVTQAGGAPLVDLLLSAPSGTEAVSPTVDARIGLVRIR
ncbi:MAG TPA: hypothetical protein VGP44_10100 [Gemmatimonadales bacterium]|nr:hypothetical protein [Gemmatimonadales bacterium]